MPLDHVDPTVPKGALYRGYTRVLRTPPGRWFAINVATKVDPWLLKRTDGRLALGLVLPSALLETTGAKSGAPRECTVLYFHDGDDVILIASSYGRDAHPSWYHNLVAHPDCVLGGERFRASEVADPAEGERLWSLAANVYGGFADYRVRAAQTGRTIPQLRLTPVAS